MIEAITRANSREMGQRYLETYGFLKTGSGKKLLVSIDNITERYTAVSDASGNKYQLTSDTGCELEFTQVPCQWFHPVKGTIVYVSRRAERQWRRGICHSNTLIQTPQRSGAGLFNISVNTATVSQILNPSTEITTAFGGLYNLNCGLWSKFFAWAENTVYVRDIMIGKVDHEIKTIALDDPDLFVQEMKDALTRSNSEYKVVNG